MESARCLQPLDLPSVSGSIDLTLWPSSFSSLFQSWSFSVSAIGVVWSLFTTPPFFALPTVSLSGLALICVAMPTHSSSPITASWASQSREVGVAWKGKRMDLGCCSHTWVWTEPKRSFDCNGFQLLWVWYGDWQLSGSGLVECLACTEVQLFRNSVAREKSIYQFIYRVNMGCKCMARHLRYVGNRGGNSGSD